MNELAQQASNGEFGLWVGCLAAFLGLIIVVFATARLFTRNFVTRDQLDTSVLKLQNGLEKDLSDTRHDLRNEINQIYTRIESKLESIKDSQFLVREAMVRIETHHNLTNGNGKKNDDGN